MTFCYGKIKGGDNIYEPPNIDLFDSFSPILGYFLDEPFYLFLIPTG